MEKQIYFVLCGSCLWCASDMAGGAIRRCPACGGAVGSRAVQQMMIKVRS